MDISTILQIVSAGFTVLMTLIGLSLKASVATLRVEIAERRAKDHEQLREWMDDRFLPSREADSRLSRLEMDHSEIEKRVRALEQLCFKTK